MRNFLVLLFLSFNLFANENVELILTGESRTDNYSTDQRVDLSSIATDGVEYDATVSCISTDRNSGGISEGYIYVMASESHMGAITKFDYEECELLVSELKSFGAELVLSWKNDKFGKGVAIDLDFDIVLY